MRAPECDRIAGGSGIGWGRVVRVVERAIRSAERRGGRGPRRDLVDAEFGEAVASAARRSARSLRNRGLGTSTGRSSEMTPSVSTSTRSASRIASSTSWVTSRTAGLVPAAQLLHQCVHADPGQGVEGAERLVEQQQLRLADQRPGQRRALRLAAGQRLGPVVLVAGEADLDAALARPRSAARVPCWPRITLSSTLAQGSSRGSWKTTERRPGTKMSPSASWSRPARARSSVLLPEPLRPSRATNSPGRDLEVDALQHLARRRRTGAGRE